jgi:molybdate transport system ATP-binding protein
MEPDVSRGFEIDLALERSADGSPPFRLEVALSAAPGVTVVFGASGAGKSSLLQGVLGALRPTSGRVSIGDRVLFDSAQGIDLSIRERRIGMVFQDALLFPHLDVRGNVAFALTAAGTPGPPEPWLERVGALELAARMPGELSGGQRQRVALARALAARPAAMLLDEPFSGLDAPARGALGEILLELQSESRVPFLHVTHDLAEAVRLGTELVVLDAGRVVQQGPPASVVAAPSSVATARAVGTENLFRGIVESHLPEAGYSVVDLGGTRVHTAPVDLAAGSAVALGLRAEDVLVSLRRLGETSARNVLQGELREIGRRGAAVELRVSTPVPFRVLVTPAAVRELRLEPGAPVWLLIKASAFHRLV